MFTRRLTRVNLMPFDILSRRFISTVEGNPHIFVFPNQRTMPGHILSLLPTDPTTPELAIGTTSKLPPTPDSVTENPSFLMILQSVVAQYATEDPEVKAKAVAMASESGMNLGSGGVFFPGQGRRAKEGQSGSGHTSGDAGGGASAQGGMGSGGRGGWIHVSDRRNPPDWGRVAWPEDIFGSLEIDAQGNFADKTGNYQSSGTYRVITREGILGLSPFLREKLIQRLRQEEANIR